MSSDDGLRLAAAGPANAGARRRTWWLALALIAVVGATHLPALRGDFLSWDDDIYVTANPLIRGLSHAHLARMATTYQLGNWHPLTTLSYALDYRLFGPDPWSFHLLNLLLHLAAALLVLRVLVALGTRPVIAAILVALWGTAPQRVEAVAWVGARKDLLAAALFLGATSAWLGWLDRGRLRSWWLSLAAFLGALLAKGTAVTFPAVLVLLDLRRGRSPRDHWMEKVPFAASAIMVGLVSLRARHSFEEFLGEREWSVLETGGLGLHRLAGYWLPRILWPVWESGLNPHDRGAGPSWVAVLAGALTVILGLFALVLLARRRSTAALGLTFLLVTLAPVLTVTNLGLSGDRFMYLPSVGFAVALSGLLRLRDGRWRGLLPALLAGVIFLPFLALTSQRECLVWRDSVSLWREAVERYPKQPLYRVHLGDALAAAGRTTEAGSELDRAVNEAPGLGAPRLHRGIFRSGQDDLAGAMADFDALVTLEPGNNWGHLNRGVVLARLGDVDGALAALDRAAALPPSRKEVYFNRGSLYSALGRYPEAVTDLDRALQIDPDYFEAVMNRGAALLAMGALAAALEDFERGEIVNPGSPLPSRHRARVLTLMGGPGEKEGGEGRATAP